MRESWLIEDRWWTDRPLRRRYWEVVTIDGRDLVVFRELTGGRLVPPPLMQSLRAFVTAAPLSRHTILAKVPGCPHSAPQDRRFAARPASTTSASSCS